LENFLPAVFGESGKKGGHGGPANLGWDMRIFGFEKKSPPQKNEHWGPKWAGCQGGHAGQKKKKNPPPFPPSMGGGERKLMIVFRRGAGGGPVQKKTILAPQTDFVKLFSFFSLRWEKGRGAGIREGPGPGGRFFFTVSRGPIPLRRIFWSSGGLPIFGRGTKKKKKKKNRGGTELFWAREKKKQKTAGGPKVPGVFLFFFGGCLPATVKKFLWRGGTWGKNFRVGLSPPH